MPTFSKEERAALENVLLTLCFREREIIKLRYGIGTGYTYTVEEVARIFKVTSDRLRLIEAKAIRKLTHPIRRDRIPRSLYKKLGVSIPCSSHKPGINGLGYVASSIEGERRMKAGWKQQKCRRCGQVYVWMSPGRSK